MAYMPVKEEPPLTELEMEEKVSALRKERQEDDKKSLRDMEKRPRCALLPSPDLLDRSISSPGSDRTDTLGDFKRVIDWVTEAEFLNPEFYNHAQGLNQERLEEGSFHSMIQLAFSHAFAPMRNTGNTEIEELVFWYYAGHGLGKKTAEKLRYSATPCLDKVMLDSYNSAADTFVKEGREVKGGELCLHDIGFCDLYGLLKPWIAAIKTESNNAQGSKKNKHLVIILDSCHSGIIAEELTDFVKETKGKDETLLRDNTVTIQTACGPDERTFGGYFTPCFVYLNDRSNATLLNELKNEWAGMTDARKTEYRLIGLPSPMVESTRPSSQDPTMEISIQNFRLTLFQDPGFFKFCSIRVYEKQQKNFLENNERVLTQDSADNFLKSSNFTVLDYKLKTYIGNLSDPHARTPMGLFLLEDPSNIDFAVCAHIHFDKGNTSKDDYKRINLIHHRKPPMGSVLYTEDHGGHKIEVSDLTKAKQLVDACYQYVNSTKPGRWEDITQWNMKGGDLGVNGLFRRRDERSSWEDKYLQYIDEHYELPKVVTG